MDKHIHPIAASAAVLICIAIFAIWFWSAAEAKNFGGPAGLTLDADGRLYIQIQNQLIEHDKNAGFAQRHDLAELGVDTLLGGTAFFADGDILLRRGPDTRSLWDTIRAYLRKENQKSLVPDAPNTGIYRCNLDKKRCDQFGHEPIDLKSAFSVFIDRESDDVFISDTSRHVVRKFTGEGMAAVEPIGGFRFPNHLMIHDGQLLVADTNHHRIRAIRIDSGEFGAESYASAVVPPVASDNEQSWPSHFARVNNEWWVINMTSAMNYGGIYAFDEAWRFTREIPLPRNADPISLVAFNGEILVSDWYGNRVHRLSTDGTALGDFQSYGLAEVLDEFASERRKFIFYAWAAVILGLLLLVIVVIKGTAWNKPITKS